MDAFATAHRAEASTCGVSKFAPVACAGPLLVAELEALSRVFDNPEHPIVAIVGGAKVSTKLTLLDELSKKVDCVIVGGGIANTFLEASGLSVGRSLCEHDLIDEAERIASAIKERGAEIILPTDAIVAEHLSDDAESCVRMTSQIAESEKIFDFGPDSMKKIAAKIKKAKTSLWNGPIGAFEISQFTVGTRRLAEAIAKSDAFSVAGGGDTLAAIGKYGVADDISYISTGGGAFLALLEGQTLPAVAALEKDKEMSGA
jgi:phosphoglycerate kinase